MMADRHFPEPPPTIASDDTQASTIDQANAEDDDAKKISATAFDATMTTVPAAQSHRDEPLSTGHDRSVSEAYMRPHRPSQTRAAESATPPPCRKRLLKVRNHDQEQLEQDQQSQSPTEGSVDTGVFTGVPNLEAKPATPSA